MKNLKWVGLVMAITIVSIYNHSFKKNQGVHYSLNFANAAPWSESEAEAAGYHVGENGAIKRVTLTDENGVQITIDYYLFDLDDEPGYESYRVTTTTDDGTWTEQHERRGTL